MQVAVQETLVQQAWLRHRFLKAPCLHLCLQLFRLVLLVPPPPLLLLGRHHVLPHRYYVEDAAGPHNFGRKQRPTLKGSQEDGVPACFEDAQSRIFNISGLCWALALLVSLFLCRGILSHSNCEICSTPVHWMAVENMKEDITLHINF